MIFSNTSPLICTSFVDCVKEMQSQGLRYNNQLVAKLALLVNETA